MVCCHGCIGATLLGMLRIVPSGCKGKGQDQDWGHHHLNIELLCTGNSIHDADRILSDVSEKMPHSFTYLLSL